MCVCCKIISISSKSQNDDLEIVAATKCKLVL